MQAKCRETGEIVAIKKVLQDKRYKNRELQIMQMLDHPNIVALKHCFFSTTDKEELYLNLVLEFVPETVNRIARTYSRNNQRMPLIYVKLYTYQVVLFDLAYFFWSLIILSCFQEHKFLLHGSCLHYWIYVCGNCVSGIEGILEWLFYRSIIFMVYFSICICN